MICSKIDIKWGTLIAGIEKDGSIVGLWFEGQRYFPNIEKDVLWINDYKSYDTEELNEVYKTLNQLIIQLKAYESGELKNFELKLSPKGTDFQKIVWEILLDIPYGESTTYGEVSKKVAQKMGKKSMAAQAVGSAIGKNPISIIIPCHRVLGADGSLTGYAGGLDKKSALLNLEGVHFEVQLEFDF